MDLSLDFQFNFIIYARLAPCCHSVSHIQLCDPMDSVDCSLPDASVHEISQARILEWIDPGIKPASPVLAGGFFTAELPRKPSLVLHCLDCLVVSFGIDMSEPSNFVLSLDCFGYPGSFIFPYPGSYISIGSACQFLQRSWGFYGDCVECVDQFTVTWIILSFMIHKYTMPFP